MTVGTLTAEKKAIPAMQEEAWRQETVGAFFARCNWDNLALPTRDLVVPGEVVALDYSLSVGQFFGAIPWEGGEMLSAIAPPASEGVQAALGSSDVSSEQRSVESGSGLDELPDLSDIADESHLDSGDVTLDDFLGAFSNSI